MLLAVAAGGDALPARVPEAADASGSDARDDNAHAAVAEGAADGGDAGDSGAPPHHAGKVVVIMDSHLLSQSHRELAYKSCVSLPRAMCVRTSCTHCRGVQWKEGQLWWNSACRACVAVRRPRVCAIGICGWARVRVVAGACCIR